MKRKVLFLVLALVTLLALAPSVFAQSELPPVDTTGIEGWLAAIGVGGLIMLGVEIAKRFGVVPDGMAGKVSAILNIVAFAGLSVAGVFGFDITSEEPQAVVDLLMRVGEAALMIISSPLLFQFLRNSNVLPPLADR